MMIRNIWAIGRNYAEHAKELGHEIPKEPFIFLKAGSSAVFESTLHLPPWGQEIHHEVELALRFDDQLQVREAAVALDLTERHLQGLAKAKGAPWTLAKSFTGSCPLSAFFPVKSLDELRALEIVLTVNGDVRQRGTTAQMIFSLEQQIDFVKAHFPVCAGDLLLTGTPSGVAAVKAGDHLKAEIVGKIAMEWNIR